VQRLAGHANVQTIKNVGGEIAKKKAAELLQVAYRSGSIKV
jgi:hypothetical protein